MEKVEGQGSMIKDRGRRVEQDDMGYLPFKVTFPVS
jgi:hypothetical protein